ncbi:MAG TPA: cytochrome c3 family protein [Thermoanaerobaculia bacterium]|nr:cytochrome c3 family protein [Thermoanaerobaculia bacterium]
MPDPTFPAPLRRASALVPCALLLALLAPGPAAGQECSDCHDGVAVTSPMHASFGCADCHSDVDLEVHPDLPVELSGQAVCGQCHEAGESVAASAHADIGCADCHGAAHQVLPPADPASPMAPVNQVQTCGGCHDAPEVLEDYLGSIHARALLKSGLTQAAPSCSDCHGSHQVLAVEEPESRVSWRHVPETCGSCHQGVLREWLELSAHGTAWRAGEQEAPVCTTCHRSHEIVQPTLDAPRLAFPDDCGGCHRAELGSYRDSFHGQATDLGFLTAATCSDCHTPHANLPAGDERSSVHPANLQETCGQCHGRVTAAFASFDPHSDPTDRQRNAAVYWIWLFMTALLIGVFAFFTLHALLWLQRILVGWRRGELQLGQQGDGPWVRRFRRSQIWTHVVVVVTFLLLAATGLPLKFHATGWASGIAEVFGGLGGTRTVHRIAAVLTFGYFAFHVAQLIRRGVVHQEPGLLWGWKSLVPRGKDLRDLWQNVCWFLYLGRRPQLDRWTYWEKFDYFAVFWGVAIIGFSGLVLWFPKAFTEVFPGWFLNAAHVVHSDEALLATGFIFIFHFFHTHLRPESFPLDPVIFTGRMPLARFREERPLEYQRLVDEGRLDEVLDEPPTEREMTLARTFGFTAVAIGLLLAIAILVGLLGGGY